MPYGGEEEIAAELHLFQSADILKLWRYENEREYEGSLSALSRTPPLVVSPGAYRDVIRYVDTRLEASVPDLQRLGFQNMEGMLLEQVVLRRRFFSQALCGVLGADTLACEAETDLQGKIRDTLQQFFSVVRIPSLIMLESEAFLELRLKSQRVLPEIVSEIYRRLEGAGTQWQKAQADVVMGLVRRYESEVLSLIRSRYFHGKAAYAAYQSGTFTEVQSKLELFLLGAEASDFTSWFRPGPEGGCQLALLLLQWRSGDVQAVRSRKVSRGRS
jgi:hypothetical protein